MNIVFITPSLKTGGGNRVFLELANQLCNDHNITILYPNNSLEHHTFHVAKSIHFQSIGKLKRTKIGKLINLIKTIIYANRHYSNSYIIFSDPLFSIFAKLLRGSKLHRFIQADDYRIFDDGATIGRGFFLKIYKHLTLKSYQSRKIHFIVNSRYVYDTLIKDSNRKDIKFNCVHPAINHKIFTPNPTNNQSICNICLVARKHPSKGLQSFIDAYQQLPHNTKNKIDHIALISHDNLADFNTTGMTVYQPTCDLDIAAVYRNSTIFISTSWEEGFGLPPLEAMACGCPCIISNSGGVNEYAVHNQNCLMYPPRNTKALITCITTLLNDISLQTRLRQNGILSSSVFSWDTSAKKLINILNETTK